MSESEEYMSFKPSDAVHGGGMVPEGRYKITDAKCAMWDYNGNVPIAVPALAVEFKNADEATFVQYYSAGDGRNWAPTPDAKRFKRVGSGTALNDGTNCFAFWRAAVVAGLSEDKVGNDCTILIGMDVDVVHEASPERDIKGQKKKAGALAVIGKIHATASETKAAAGKGAATTKSNSKSNGAGDASTSTSLQPKAIDVLMTVLKAAEGRQLEKKAITTAAFRQFPANDNDRAAVLNMLIDNAFLASLGDHGVLYDADKSLVMYVGE